uniref:Reverse transcriptase domain-containing protein n=1 Tax=Trichobilharzia regenti TaxID=157069 RepID=A0AA85IV35_TRIRE|nr:unnamed protein product [Trichobilharzia regenti]
MNSSRIIYSRNFINNLRPNDFHIPKKPRRKHRSGWQRALKRTPIHLTTVPVIMNSNCRSLPNKIMYLQSLMSTDTYHNTAIIALQETWLHELYDDNLISLKDFILFRQDRRCCNKKNGGGVATFIHSKWSVSNNICFTFSNDFIDCITVKCRPKHIPKYKQFYITNMYISPSCSPSDLSNFADEFTMFAAANFDNSLSVITGDFNTSDCSFLEALGHTNIVKFPTRLDKTLDLVFTNDEGVYETRRRSPIHNSDHCIVRVLPKIYSKTHIKIFSHLSTKAQQRSYTSDNLLNLRCMLKDTNWDLFNESKLDDTIANITDYLKFCLDICCPKQTLFKRLDRFSSPHLKQLRRQKEMLYKCKDKLGLKKINAQIKSEIKNLNAIYNQTLLSCKSPNSMWKLFNEITGNSKRCNVFPSCDVNALNLSFIRSPSTITTPNVTNLVADNFQDFNTLDVLKCLKTLKPSHSLGPDGIPAYVLKQCADALCSPLTNILNASFSENVVPVPWKDIKIVPVPKPGNSKNVKFRPIAITSPFLKLMEKLILLKLEPSLKSFEDPKQFAYRQGRSTLDAAAVLHNSIVSSLDKDAKYVRCTFLDFTSAFDSVPRSLLLNKLSTTQTESWVTKWLHSYFSNRMQYTVYKGQSSSAVLTESGVPQGAVLSPLLFSFFLHDLPSSNDINFVKYADDLTVSLPVKCQNDCSKLNGFLSEISQWSKENGLTLNPSKCQTVNFTFRHKSDLNKLVSAHEVCNIDGTEIETKSEIKYLGVTLSSDLSWSSHILTISKKIYRLTFYIKKLRHSGVTQPLLLQFVNSRILPIILYCSPLVFPGLLKKDYTLLRRMLKVVSRVSSLPLSQLVNILVDRHMDSCEKWAKSILSDSQHPLHSQLSPCISSGKTRSLYRKLYARTSKYKNSSIPYLARVLCDKECIRHETFNLLNSH